MSLSRSNDVIDVYKILDKFCSRLENFIVIGVFFIFGFFDIVYWEIINFL